MYISTWSRIRQLLGSQSVHHINCVGLHFAVFGRRCSQNEFSSVAVSSRPNSVICKEDTQVDIPVVYTIYESSGQCTSARSPMFLTALSHTKPCCSSTCCTTNYYYRSSITSRKNPTTLYWEDRFGIANHGHVVHQFDASFKPSGIHSSTTHVYRCL